MLLSFNFSRSWWAFHFSVLKSFCLTTVTKLFFNQPHSFYMFYSSFSSCNRQKTNQHQQNEVLASAASFYTRLLTMYCLEIYICTDKLVHLGRRAVTESNTWLWFGRVKAESSVKMFWFKSEPLTSACHFFSPLPAAPAWFIKFYSSATFRLDRLLNMEFGKKIHEF